MLPILFQNDDVVAVDKPAGVACAHGREGEDSTLSAASAGLGQRLWVVHRLDKEVSGVLLFARNAEAHRRLNRQFDMRLVRKEYFAVAHGAVRADRGTIRKPLREFGSGRMGVDARRGKKSLTAFSVSERLGAFTALTVRPVTGRRHQIRAHLYSIGHPVVGDGKYGDRGSQGKFGRLMLHARLISFDLPSGERINVESPLPADITAFVQAARSHAAHPSAGSGPAQRA
jgi:RluA family pseudouridine synthase